MDSVKIIPIDSVNNDTFDNDIHKFGRLSGGIIFLLMIAFPLLLSFTTSLFPNFLTLISPILTISTLMISYAIAEIIAYPPIIGAASVYMCYITGNVTNLKMPCAVSTIASAGYENGTKEGDSIAMIAIGISTLTVIVIILISILLLKYIAPVISNPALKPAFDNVMPALIGGLVGVVLAKKDKIKLVYAPLLVSIIGLLVLSLETVFVLPVALIASIVVARILYKKGL